MAAADYTPERLADRAQITDVMYRWCRAIDRLDADAIRSVFHPDAIDNHGPFVGGVDALIAWLTGRHRTIPFSMHLVSNILIEFAAADSALVETYIFATLRYSPEGKAALAVFTGGAAGPEGSTTDALSWARYIDRFERRGGEWRIARRTVAFDSTAMLDAGPNPAAFDPSWAIGRRDQDDPIYRERAAMGLA
jgi:ketosteroid isomerase-like protein